LILGGVDFVTVLGKLVGEALERTGRIVKEEGDSLNDGRSGGGGKRISGDRIAVV
jgi:hypothetical protein